MDFKGVLHPWTLFWKTLCIFSTTKATLLKLCNGSDQKCSKELKNHSFYFSGDHGLRKMHKQSQNWPGVQYPLKQ